MARAVTCFWQTPADCPRAELYQRMDATHSSREVIQLPETMPRDDRKALWALQLELLSMAESILGRRDKSKKIYQPQFSDEGPRIRNTPNLDGAFCELSRAGDCYWPTVVFEMAHETVHLLNPVAGNANNLEEGVAVAFSLCVQPMYGISVQPPMPSYRLALQLSGMLPGGPLRAAKLVRDRVGSLNDVTAEGLRDLFPSIDEVVSRRLAERFSGNVG